MGLRHQNSGSTCKDHPVHGDKVSIKPSQPDPFQALFAWLNRDHEWHWEAAEWMTELSTSSDLVLCELCLVELYGLLRNPAVVERPLEASAAVAMVQNLRSHPYWELVDYPGGLMGEIWPAAAAPRFARRRIYDARLALTLRHHGVTELATTNVKDSRGLASPEFGIRWSISDSPPELYADSGS